MQKVFVTGYKSFELGVFKNDSQEATYIKLALQKNILNMVDEGLEWVIISGQLGVELWAAEAVIQLKQLYPHLQLAIMPPFVQHDSNWNEVNKEYYQFISSQADFVKPISNHPYISPMQFKNRDLFLLEKTDAMLILYDDEREGSPQYIWELAKKHAENYPYEIRQITFYDLQQVIEEEASKHNNEW